MTAELDVVSLALLDGYKVRWDRETVARDVVQNFFDEVTDFREVTIDVDAKQKRVEVRGPSRFDMDYLRYIGATTKAAPERRTAGEFGEGFKICALVLLRDFDCKVIAGSADWQIRPFLRAMKLGRELCYEVTRLPSGQAHAGSFTRILGADRRLCEIFKHAKDFFRHPENPRLKTPIFVDEQAGIGVYASADRRTGDIFYRRQHRGALSFSKGEALTFAFDGRIAKLEGDRDRRNVSAALPLVAALAKHLPDEVIERLIRRLRLYWQGGNRILGALIAEAKARSMKLSFPTRWLARTKTSYLVEAHAERIGFHLGVKELASIGMRTADDRFGQAVVPRRPTAVEAARMTIAWDLYTHLLRAKPVYPTVRIVDIANPWTSWSSFSSCTMVANHLNAPFGEGIALCLAALAIGSGSTAEKNAGRITHLLEGAIRHAGMLQPYEERWTLALEDPSRETIDPNRVKAGKEESRSDRRRRTIPVTIVAPPGFPPAEAIGQQITSICEHEGLLVDIYPFYVHGSREAASEYARGIPSVWVGNLEIEPIAGRPPSYSVRTFALERDPSGETAPKEQRSALIPGDDVLRTALRTMAERIAAGKRTPIAYMRKRIDRGCKALRSWQRRHTPEEYRDELITDAIRDATKGAYDEAALAGVPWSVHYIAEHLAQCVLRLQPDVEHLGQDVIREAVRGAYRAVTAVLVDMERCAEGVTKDTPANRMALTELLDRALNALRQGTREKDAIFVEATELAQPVLSICQWVDTVPLDSTCAQACTAAALQCFWEACAERDPSFASSRARERFDTAVEHAIHRHDQRDEDGEPPPCRSLKESLDVFFGIRRENEKENELSEAAELVRATWEQALAEGIPELAAAERCLGAARRFEEKREP